MKDDAAIEENVFVPEAERVLSSEESRDIGRRLSMRKEELLTHISSRVAQQVKETVKGVV